MQARLVAAKLQQAGINFLNFTEGDDLEDGAVYISESVHVQVPTYDTGINVVQQLDEETFAFYPIRKSIKDVLIDLKKALAN